MAKEKLTVYLDEDLVRGMKVLAARTGRSDYEVLESALRSYLGLDALERIWAGGGLGEDEALETAYRELAEARRANGAC